MRSSSLFAGIIWAICMVALALFGMHTETVSVELAVVDIVTYNWSVIALGAIGIIVSAIILFANAFGGD